MIVKIFYPKSLFYEKNECSLYGEVAIEENSISYFIISSQKEAGYRRLGCSSEAGNEISCDVSLKFAFDDNYPHVYLINVSVKTSGNAENVIILYEPENLFKLHSSENVAIEDTNDIDLLKVLLERHSETSVKTIGSTIVGVFGNVYHIFCKMRQFIIAYICSLFRHTKLNDFFVGWKSCLDSEDVPEKQRGKVAFDVITGVLVMAWVFFNEPGKYAPNISKNIILQMRTLIQSLKGNPIGLKLNAQLNNFFLDCSTYHMDLWATFIEIIGPSIFYFIFPIGVLGILGLSFQLAILSDLIILLSLHAQSFFVFASVLYNLEKVGISALWKVVLGRRKNVLKGRAESHDYMNRQLYLATIFFTTLLFLLPTVFVYYVVFATLRIAIFLINFILIKLQKKLLQFPIDHLMKWMCGCYYDIGDIEIEYVTSVVNEIGPTTSIFQLHIMKSSPLKNSIMRPSNNLPKNTIKLFDAVKAAINGKLINFV